MNKLKRILQLKESLQKKQVDKFNAITELQSIINSKDIDVKEFDVYKKELQKILAIKEVRLSMIEKINKLNDNSSDIIEFLNLRENEMEKIKNMGVKLIISSKK